MGFRSLRVINDDKIVPKGGFPMHPHRDMEIFSYIVNGQISHSDTMGNSRTLGKGEVQLMSTGAGIEHSEYNPSATEPLHLLQIWITPNQRGLSPSYTEWQSNSEQKNASKVLLISPNGRDGSATIHQDADVYRVKLHQGQQATHTLKEGRGLWIQIVQGEVSVDGELLQTGDALSTESSGIYELKTNSEVELLLFDLN